MIIVNANTKKGQALINRAENWEGKFLNQVYDKWSDAKQKAWDRCYEICLAEGGEDFSIVSHNTYGFTVSWFATGGVRLETPQNSYLVVFD